MKLEKITWPTSDKVVSQFFITLVGIIVLIIFFLIADQFISSVLKNFYV